MNTYCKHLLWCHIIDGFTVSTCACQLLQTTLNFLAGHINCPLPCTWPASRSLFAWNLCIQTKPHDIHLVPETEWITPVRVGTASPGAARFPSHCGRLGCTLRSGTCACQMLFSLSFPNLLISCCSEQTKKAYQSQEKNQLRLHFFCCVRVISILYFMCKWRRLEMCFFLVSTFPYVSSKPLPPSPSSVCSGVSVWKCGPSQSVHVVQRSLVVLSVVPVSLSLKGKCAIYLYASDNPHRKC